MKITAQIDKLKPFVTENKQSLIRQVLDQRTRQVTVVLEDIYQSQNASAVIRTSECFGIQDVHVVEKKHKYTLNPRVVHGASKWMSLYQYNQKENRDIDDCLDELKKRGYTLYATSVDPEARDIHSLIPDHKMAFIFGTEISGISDKVREKADHFVHIPMVGFTESYNISVSAALVLQVIIQKLREMDNISWGLSDLEKQELTLEWYKKVVKNAELILEKA